MKPKRRRWPLVTRRRPERRQMFKFEIGQAVRLKTGTTVGKVTDRAKFGGDNRYDVDWGLVCYTYHESRLEPAADPSAPDARMSQPAASSSLGLSQGSADETTDTTEPANETPAPKFSIGQRVIWNRSMSIWYISQISLKRSSVSGWYYDYVIDIYKPDGLAKNEPLSATAREDALVAAPESKTAAPSSLGLSQGSADETTDATEPFGCGQTVREIGDLSGKTGTVWNAPDPTPERPYRVYWHEGVNESGIPVRTLGRNYAASELEIVTETTDPAPTDDNPPVQFKFRLGDRVLATVPLIDFYDRKVVEIDDTVRVVRARVQTEDGALLYGLSQDGRAVEKPLYAGEEGLIPAPEPETAPTTITATERATGKQVELLSSVPVHYGRHIDAKGRPLVVIDGIVIGTCEEVADDARAAFSSPHSTA